VCVVDAARRIVSEAKAHSERDVLIAWSAEPTSQMEQIGLEAGPLSKWLYAGMTKTGLASR
jgi:hypothetical protein